MPMMPFMGVRISWLMLARNSLLARLAASASSLACFSCASASFRSLMSRRKKVKTGSPWIWLMVMAISAGNSSPLARAATNSVRLPNIEPSRADT